MVVKTRTAVWIVAVVVLAGCDIVTSTPFPDFLGYTDISVNLSDEIDDIWGDRGEIEYELDVVYSATDVARVLLVVEPPAEYGDSFEYRGRLLIFDENLDLIVELEPPSDLDFFERPFAYTHDGLIIASTMLIQPDGYLYDASIVFQGLDGPAIADTANTRTYVFSPPAGAFSTFEIDWQEYFGTADTGTDPDTIYSLTASGSFPIVPPSAQSGGDESGYQILDAFYDEASDEVTFLLSEPTGPRVIVGRATLSDITAGTVDSLVEGPGAFSAEVSADRPLDYHIDENGFFLRRRDGLLGWYEWNASGDISDSESAIIAGDRYFFRQYAFLSGASPSGNEYMYRFDPDSRVLTRYTRWW